MVGLDDNLAHKKINIWKNVVFAVHLAVKRNIKKVISEQIGHIQTHY